MSAGMAMICGPGTGMYGTSVSRRCMLLPACKSSRLSVRPHLQQQCLSGRPLRSRLRHKCTLQSSSTDAGATVDRSEEQGAVASQDDGHERITVTLRKPMGMVLAEGKSGEVFVESIVEVGNAAEEGSVKVGDVIRKTRAYVLKEGKSGEYAKKGHGARPFEDYVPIMFPCDGEDFKTVMAAIGSNNERWGIFEVELELSRPSQ